jgi:hypothetical protein
MAIIVVGLVWLKGQRRVFRWVLIPLSAVLFTIIGLIAVNLFVDFRPEVQISKAVFSIEGWPQEFVHASVMHLGFEEGRTNFTAPYPAQFDWDSTEGHAFPVESRQEDQSTSFSIRQEYGRFSTVNLQWWAPAESFCQITPDRKIVVSRPLRGAWVWDSRKWRSLGPLNPGQPVSINQGNIIIDPAKEAMGGSPVDSDRPWREMLPEAVRRMCSTKYMKTLDGTDVGIVIGVEASADSPQMADAAGSDQRLQTIRFYQFRLPPIQP